MFESACHGGAQSLQAAPHLCLSLGMTRTPRNPFQTQAQLAPCAVVDNTAAAMRARLHFSSEAGTIKTTHRVSDFRSGLPEHSLACGFWPACVDTQLLLPKPCWAQVSHAAMRNGTLPTFGSVAHRYSWLTSPRLSLCGSYKAT